MDDSQDEPPLRALGGELHVGLGGLLGRGKVPGLDQDPGPLEEAAGLFAALRREEGRDEGEGKEHEHESQSTAASAGRREHDPGRSLRAPTPRPSRTHGS
jgi:hypothetical protein